jgi:hypothetical protein
MCLIWRAVHTTAMLTWHCMYAERDPIRFGRLPRHSLSPEAVLNTIPAAVPSAAVSDSVQEWRRGPAGALHARI